MKIYFNWLGEWKKIDNEKDIICCKKPINFVEDLIKYSNKELLKKDWEYFHFVDILKKEENKLYNVHLSQIMWVEEE